RLGADAPTLRVARQELCRKYNVVDPLPRPAPAAVEAETARSIDIKDIAAIEPAEHPWKELLAGRQAQIEPLAQCVPAGFYYLRVRTPNGLAVLDKLQQWVALAPTLRDGAGHDARLRDR